MLNRTPFFDIHEKAGAKLVDFGGWEMPVQYSGIKNEHNAVRNGVGLFDVSHMGEFLVQGSEALDLIQLVTVNDVSKLSTGKAQYTVMCYENGGIVDDLLVYQLSDQKYMLVVNAANISKDFDWIDQHHSFDAELKNISDDMCLLAVQGPKAPATLQKLTGEDLAAIPFYTFKENSLAGFDGVIISATGYTGEKGFELYFDKNKANPAEIWDAVMNAGREFDIQPCGLGARDTLRLEMGYALYGNDITRETNPLEAGMGWLTKLDKTSFIGLDTLKTVKQDGIERKLMGFVIDDKRAIPRHGYPIEGEEGETIGAVTSGTRSITLGQNIGMGYLPIEYAQPGQKVYVRIRGKTAEAEVTKLPFIQKK